RACRPDCSPAHPDPRPARYTPAHAAPPAPPAPGHPAGEHHRFHVEDVQHGTDHAPDGVCTPAEDARGQRITRLGLSHQLSGVARLAPGATVGLERARSVSQALHEPTPSDGAPLYV